jgi:hypothetical protein
VASSAEWGLTGLGCFGGRAGSGDEKTAAGQSSRGHVGIVVRVNKEQTAKEQLLLWPVYIKCMEI